MLPTGLIVFQCCGCLLMFCAGLLGAFIPYLMPKVERMARILEYLNCASAGVLLGVALMHMLPSASGTLVKFANGYQVNYFLMSCSLIGMMWLFRLGDHRECQCKSVLNAETPEVVEVKHGFQKFQSTIVLLLGLAVHSLTAGITLGLTKDFSGALPIFFALILHKWCAVCAQSLSGIRNGIPRAKNIIFAAVLSTVTPIGTIIGVILNEVLGGMHASSKALRNLHIADDAFIYLASGTFFPIVFEEIVYNSMPVHPGNLSFRDSDGNKLGGREAARKLAITQSLKMTTLFGGFLFMVAISIMGFFVGA